MFPIMHFLSNCAIITRFFFIGIFTERIEWCEEGTLSSSLAFLSTWNESVLQDRLDAERTTDVKNTLFSIVKNRNVPHQLKRNCNSTRVSLNCSKVSQRFFGILTVLEHRLAASLISRSQSLSEKYRAPCFAKAFSNTGLIVSQ